MRRRPVYQEQPLRKARNLQRDELAIWQKVAETVAPLHPRKLPDLDDRLSAAGRETAVPKVVKKNNRSLGQLVAATRHTTAVKPPEIAGLNRRDTQKLARGNVEIDGRIDLHGMSVARARLALLSFLEASRNIGRRNVLVITGKGASPFTQHTLHSTDVYQAPERKGVLRAELPGWLHERDFSRHVVGFQPAHPRHGGGGAFYVRLKSKSNQR